MIKNTHLTFLTFYMQFYSCRRMTEVWRWLAVIEARWELSESKVLFSVWNFFFSEPFNCSAGRAAFVTPVMFISSLALLYTEIFYSLIVDFCLRLSYRRQGKVHPLRGSRRILYKKLCSTANVLNVRKGKNWERNFASNDSKSFDVIKKKTFCLLWKTLPSAYRFPQEKMFDSYTCKSFSFFIFCLSFSFTYSFIRTMAGWLVGDCFTLETIFHYDVWGRNDGVGEKITWR